MGTQFQFGKLKNFLRWMVGWLHDNVNVLIPLKCALINGQSDIFYIMSIYHNKKKFNGTFNIKAGMWQGRGISICIHICL